MNPSAGRHGHLLVYEPRTEGHHLGWLRFITEDLLGAGVQLTLAVDRRPEHETRIRDHLGAMLSEVTLINVREARRPWWAARSRGVAQCLRQSGAASVFLCAFDEIASDCWRRAAIGLFPPAELRGRMGGIYHRPRFVAASWPKRWFKQIGFRRLVEGRWLRQLLMMDEFMVRDLQARHPGGPVAFLPDPCPLMGELNAPAARADLGVPADRRVFLFYGTGARRKGLHLAVRAMRELPPEVPAFLLCAGQLNPDGETARGLEELVAQKRARLINRYVTAAEEKLVFAASDVVLLPYVHHFGNSGVLSRAMAAGRMVIVSDEELLGRMTRTHGLGLLFPSGDVPALRARIEEAARLGPEQLAAYSQAAEKYAAIYSREAYRLALTRAVLNPEQSPHA
jgi:glycosyltransferase involved in cell wall biosynthesis